MKDYDSGIISRKLAAKYFGITPRRFRQIHKIYGSTGNIPAIGVNPGRPKKEVPEEWNEIIKQILCGINHPHNNGKQETFHDFYKNHGEDLIVWIRWPSGIIIDLMGH